MMTEKKNILILTGGSVDYEWAGKWLENRKYHYCIAADSGLVHADRLKVKIDYILGDYDSVDKTVLDSYKNNTKTVTYPAEKDYTDTHIALLKAIEQKPDNIDILGATGSRYDHALTNIFLLKQALQAGVECNIYDRNNKIYLLDKTKEITKENQYGSYVSLVPMTENVQLTLEGFKYPLERYNLSQGLSICQSNEVILETAQIIVHCGTVVVFETKD